ncbi:hypothetical protein GC176_13255 [bacterium]|nr:hypothetical protein [bacterium]
MSSSMDVYSPCPCGSGKKVKFCCGDALKEMDRVARLHENQQIELALQALDKIAEKAPDAPIVPITRAQLLMEEQRFDEAESTMREFLKDNPNSGTGNGLLAYARFLDVGFHEAKPEIYRAFQVCPATAPDLIGSLAAQIAEEVYRSSSMSAREHTALALRLSTDARERQALFQQLMTIDGAPEIPYPMRGPHQLTPIEPTEEIEKDLKTAVRMSTLGCWEIAVKLFEKIAEQLPGNWAVWKNIGLCYAWDTDHVGAALALHKAALLAMDVNYEVAVECETLAQLLELPQVEDQIKINAARFRLDSTSASLSRLDDCDRLERLQNPPDQEQKNPKVVGRYLALDKPAPDIDVPVSDDNVPIVLAEISVFDLATQDGSRGVLSVIGSDDDDRARAITLIQETLGAQLLPPEEGETEDGKAYVESPVRLMLKELAGAQEKEYYGVRIDISTRRDMARQNAVRFVTETWANTPLNRLGGKTPREAATEDSLRIKLAAAVHVLEAVSDVAMLYVDMTAFRQSLNIAPEKQIEVTDDLSLNSLSVMESHRLPIEKLSDEQLAHIVNRALLIRHQPFAYAVLTEVGKRNLDNLEIIDRRTFLRTISQVCRDLGYREEAIKWIRQAREEVDATDQFEERLNWAMREFQFRVEDRSDEALPGLIDELWNYFGGKLPEIRSAMAPVLQDLSLPIPGESASGIFLTESTSSSGSESKLWLPD